MIPENRIPTHPGEILYEEFLKPLNISQKIFSHHIGIPLQDVKAIINEKGSVTPQIAWFFSQALGTTPEFWMNLQMVYDLAVQRPRRRVVKLQAVPAFA